MTGQVGHARPAAPAPAAPAAPHLSAAVVPGIAVLLAAVLLVGIALAAFQSDTASAATTLVEGEGVTATLEDGSATALSVGDDVPNGATVVAPDGAVLRTRDRDVLLGPQARVTVVDGARQVLEDGFVMVDARGGPEVDVETAAAVVTTPEGAVSRIEPGAVLRVGGFAGDPLSVRAVGRRATAEVEALHQVQVPVGGLPARVTPLALTGDRYEHRVAADLLAADRALVDLGRTLDSAGDQGPAVLTALRTALPAMAPADPAVRQASTSLPAAPAAPAAPRSEPALAFLLAAAPLAEVAEADAGALALPPGDLRLAERYAEARDLRAAGGSWGVVAGLVDSPVSAVGSLLDQLLSPLVLAVGDAPPTDLLSLLVPPTAAPLDTGGSGTGSGPGSGTGTAPPPSGGSGTPPPPAGPPPAEPPPPGPGLPPPPGDPGDPEETVEEIIETVIGLLPDPPDLPDPPAPAPRPAPEPSLLGPLLAD